MTIEELPPLSASVGNFTGSPSPVVPTWLGIKRDVKVRCAVRAHRYFRTGVKKVKKENLC